jgi:hypothetical protein
MLPPDAVVKEAQFWAGMFVLIGVFQGSCYWLGVALWTYDMYNLQNTYNVCAISVDTQDNDRITEKLTDRYLEPLLLLSDFVIVVGVNRYRAHCYF